MTFWREEKTPDGWTYGYGEYKKSIVDIVKVPAYKSLVGDIQAGPLSSTLKSLLQSIEAKLVAAGKTAIANAVKSMDQHTAVPTYYLWAYKWGASPTDPAKKIIGGEWNFLTGGKDALLSWWPTFDKCMRGSGSFADACISQTWYWPTIKSSGAISDRPDDEFPTSGMLLPLAIIGGAVLYALLGRR